MDDLIAAAEIAQWRDDQRLRIDEEMRALAGRLTARFCAQIDELDWQELILPGRILQGEIERRLVSEMNRAYVRHRRELGESATKLMRELPKGESNGLDFVDGAGLAAGGVLAIGSVVGAAGAGTLAMTTTTTAFLFTATAFSWPIFLGLAVPTLVAAVASPTLAGAVVDRVRRRGREGIESLVEKGLLGQPGGDPARSVRLALFANIDEIARAQLAEVTG